MKKTLFFFFLIIIGLFFLKSAPLASAACGDCRWAETGSVCSPSDYSDDCGANTHYDPGYTYWQCDACPANDFPTASITGPSEGIVGRTITFTGNFHDSDNGVNGLKSGEIWVTKSDQSDVSSWCVSPYAVRKDSTGKWCLLASASISGNDSQKNGSWTPQETGTYYAVVNAYDGGDQICTGNPFTIPSGMTSCGAGSKIDVVVSAAPAGGLKASCSTGGFGVTLSWNAAAGATSYKIRLDNKTLPGRWVPGEEGDKIIDGVTRTNLTTSTLRGEPYGWSVQSFPGGSTVGGIDFTCLPSCDTTGVCGACGGGSYNTCGSPYSTNGTQSCTYTGYTGGGSCTPVSYVGKCSYDNCDSANNYYCETGMTTASCELRNCNATPNCGEWSTPVFPCGTNNSLRTCTYTTYNGSTSCNQVSYTETSTRDTCSTSTNYYCLGGACTLRTCNDTPNRTASDAQAAGLCTTTQVNNCSAGNGTYLYQYTKYNGTTPCTLSSSRTGTCTKDACSTGYKCSSGACVAPQLGALNVDYISTKSVAGPSYGKSGLRSDDPGISANVSGGNVYNPLRITQILNLRGVPAANIKLVGTAFVGSGSHTSLADLMTSANNNEGFILLYANQNVTVAGKSFTAGRYYVYNFHFGDNVDQRWPEINPDINIGSGSIRSHLFVTKPVYPPPSPPGSVMFDVTLFRTIGARKWNTYSYLNDMANGEKIEGKPVCNASGTCVPTPTPTPASSSFLPSFLQDTIATVLNF